MSHSPSDSSQVLGPSTLKNADVAGESSEPGIGGQNKRSRTRMKESCERCRLKKNKCNREFPCGTCTKNGRSGRDCSYRDGCEEEDIKEDDRAFKKIRVVNYHSDTVKRGADLRVAEKTAILGEPMSSGGSSAVDARRQGDSRQSWTVPDAARTTAEPFFPIPPSLSFKNGGTAVSSFRSSHDSSRTLGRIDVKGKGSRYVAPGDKSVFMDHFGHSKSFIVDGLKDPSIVGLMQELHAYHRAMLPVSAKIEPTSTSVSGPADKALATEMWRAMPSDSYLEILKARYISDWENVQRVLHIGCFLRECDEAAAARGESTVDIADASTPIGDWILPQILAVVAIVSRLHDQHDANSASESEKISDDQVARNVELVKRWLDQIPEKATNRLHTLQIRTLLLLAQEANMAPSQELWKESGTLVRHAMIMGLHQDPEENKQMSALDKELRRRLWTTIVELDMQFSLGAGMPAATVPSNFQLGNLINASDEDLPDNSQDYPAGKSVDADASGEVLPQIALSFSLQDRLSATNLLGGHLNLEQDTTALLSLAKTLEKAVQPPPQQLRTSFRAGHVIHERMSQLFASIKLDMSIRRPLLAIYRTVAMGSSASYLPQARRGAFRCALAILSHLDALDPTIADPGVVQSKRHLNLFHILYKNDITQAALLVCNEIRSLKGVSRSVSTGDEPQESIPPTKPSLTRVVDDTLNSLLSRLGEFGCDLKDILAVSIVLQSVRAEGSGDEIQEAMKKGAQRVLTACQRAMPLARSDPVAHKALGAASPGDSWSSDMPADGKASLLNAADMMSIGGGFNFTDLDSGWPNLSVCD
ncbi:hypothetical protein BUE80_DR005432 [Diplocarpon rosae]|nr:hypothetical protein BUE80_DR005432 [Diplocarpon rosae]